MKKMTLIYPIPCVIKLSQSMKMGWNPLLLLLAREQESIHLIG